MNLLGKYEIIEELGKGGFGTVYKAEDRALGRIVALKVLHPELMIYPSFLEQFRKEAKISASLDHPNLVTIYDFTEIEGRQIIVLKYMSGGSLKDLLNREGKLSLDRSFQLMEQICNALDYAHSKSIIHRDLKPGNILLDDAGAAHISDLGFAKVVRDNASLSMSVSGGIVGTPAYMSPEIWRNKKIGPQSDIYSLGCILYEMLTAKVLFDGETPAESMTKHLIDGPQYSDELPIEIKNLLEKALAQNPDNRLVDAKAFLKELQTAINPIPTPEPEPHPDNLEKEEEQSSITISKESVEDAQPPLEQYTYTNKRAIVREYNKQIDDDNNNRTTSLKNPTDPTRIQEIYSHTGSVNCLVWLPDGKTLVSAGNDNRICLWNTENGKKSIVLTGHMHGVKSLVCSPDGSLFASGGADGTIFLWKYQELKTFSAIKPWLELENHQDSVNSLFFSPEGNFLASSDVDGIINVWDLMNGGKNHSLLGHSNITSNAGCVVKWSPNSSTLASAGDDGKIVLWDGRDGSLITELIPSGSSISALAWSPDGKYLASGGIDKTISVWDVSSRRIVGSLDGHTNSILDLAWSSDGKLLASYSISNSIILWDMDKMREKLNLMHSSPISSLAWSPINNTLASGGRSGTISLWDLKNNILNQIES